MSSLDSTESQWKEVFDIYDTDKDGKISRVDFVSAVRVLGRRYTEKQMEEKLKAFGDPISWDHFEGFMCDPYTGPTVDDLNRALKAFDGKDTGELTISQLTSLMTTMGDKMRPDEAASSLDGIESDQGKVKISNISPFFTPPIPSTTPNIDALLKEVMKEEAQRSPVAAELNRVPAAAAEPEDAAEGSPLSAEE